MTCLSRNTPMTDDLTAVSETGCAIVKHMREQRDNDKRLAVDRPVGQQMLNNMGTTQFYKLEEDGRIKSFLIGSRRVILTASIYDYLIEEAIRSHPAGQPPLKLDKPLSRRWRERREKAASDAQSARKAHPAGRKARQGRARTRPRSPELWRASARKERAALSRRGTGKTRRPSFRIEK